LIVAACDGLIAQYFILKTFGCFSLADLFPPLPLLLPTEKEEKKGLPQERSQYPNCAHHNLKLFSNDKQPLSTT
jgi:hypothetical protein